MFLILRDGAVDAGSFRTHSWSYAGESHVDEVEQHPQTEPSDDDLRYLGPGNLEVWQRTENKNGKPQMKLVRKVNFAPRKDALKELDVN